MCRETLFSWRPLLSLCCGLLVGFIPVQDDIIVQAEGEKILYKDTAWNPFIACLHFSTTHCYWILNSSRSNVAHFVAFLFLVWLLVPVAIFVHCQISGHVTTMLFIICLQKLNTAMPPCRPSSAAERGKAWKGKAKTRKTQVAGKKATLLFAATNYVILFFPHFCNK